MASGAQTFSKMLKLLRETSNAKEKREALTYIRSNSKRMESTNAIKEEQYKELCRLVIDVFSNGDDSMHLEAYETLSAIIRDFKDHTLNLFDAMILANRKSRLKLIKLLEALDDNVILTLTWDMGAVNFFKDCLYNVQIKNMDWLSPASCENSLQPLIQAENKPLTPDQKLEEETITHVMTLLKRLYKLAVMTSDLKIEKFDILLVEKVTLLAYMGHKRQRDPALKLLQQSLSTDIGLNIRTNHADAWSKYKSALQATYCKRMLLLADACEVDWATQWSVSIQLLGTDLHRGAGLINNLLSVEEKAFKSTEAIIRRQAFLSWKLLVDNFALDPQELATARRVKLLCIPLTAKNSKTELIALTKLEVWWHAIIKLYKDIKPFTNPMISQFLNFCFGPLGDTPLLSSKYNVLASPGKRFYKTKVVALDALCQLLVNKSENQNVFSAILEERLPHAITDAVFQECYQTVIHSVAEALLILSQLTDSEMKSKYLLAKVFWKSLVNYVQETECKEKESVYKNVILVTTELISYASDKPMIKELFLDTILLDLSNFTETVAFEDETTATLASQIFQTPLMLGAGKKEYEALERILRRSIKPYADAPYRANALKHLKMLLGNLTSSTDDPYWHAFELELWKVLAHVLIKYTDDSEDINEGNAAKHDFTTVESILMFPFHHTGILSTIQVREVAAVWKELYDQFTLHSDLVTTVTPNEIVTKTAQALKARLPVNKDHTSLMVNCLDALLNSINYKVLLGADGIPVILQLLLELALSSFSAKSHTDCDIVLKALSAFLITVYGHDAERVVSYLVVCEPVVELALKADSTVLSKEVSNIWETVVSIFIGLRKHLSHALLSTYKDTLIEALNHKNPEIELQALDILELQGKLNADADALLETLAKKMKKDKFVNMAEISKRKKELNGKVSKSVKQVGSFLGRSVASPAPSVTSHERDERKPVFIEPESQDYVFIKTELKFDINRMTEHQKETLKRRRDDIPALYNDLSQSSSQDSQNLQEWFDRKSKHIAETDRPSSVTDDVLDHDANKENKIVASKSETTDKLPNAETQIKPVGHVPESGGIELTHSPKGSTEKEQEQSKEQNVPAEETSKGNEQNMANATAKKLNFDCREEFPDDGSSSSSRHSPSLLENGKRRRRTVISKTDCGDSGIQTESITSTRVLRRKAKGTELGKEGSLSEDTSGQTNVKEEPERGMKRKAASDSEFEGQNVRRRRKLNENLEVSRNSHSLPAKPTENSTSSDTSDELANIQDTRIRMELNRLQINMVFDCSSQNRRRSKPVEDKQRESSSKRDQSPEKEKPRSRAVDKAVDKEDKSRRSVSPSHRTARRSKRKSSRLEPETHDPPTAKNIVENKDNQVNTQSEETMGIVENTLLPINEDVEMHAVTTKTDDVTVKEAEIKEHMPEAPKDTKESKDTAKEDKVIISESIPQDATQTQFDVEEIVESSQDTDEFMKIDRKYKDKQYFVKVSKMEEADKEENAATEESKLSIETESKEISVKVDNLTGVIHTSANGKKDELAEQVLGTGDSQVESSQEEERRPTSNEIPKVSDALSSIKNPLLGFPSPKNNIKRFTKFKPQGRAAHMLGLVTKQSRLESDGSTVLIDEELSLIKQRVKDARGKELDSESSAKKDRPSTPTTPCSSRQEKIFNNMKSSEFSTPTPIKLFSNLKNDGEKVSPNLEKAKSSAESSGEGQSEKQGNRNSSPSPEREQLPMLEWSRANPPSLTASPSASILKRHRQSAPEPDPDTNTPTKRKRVSFADPPVSKEMEYQIAEPTSPHKVNKLSSARSLTNRRDSPYRYKHTKPKFIEIDSENHLLKENELNVENNDIHMECEPETEIIPNSITDTESMCAVSEVMNFDLEPTTINATDLLVDDLPVPTQNKVIIDNLNLEIEITETTAACGKVAATIVDAKESNGQMQKDKVEVTKSPVKLNLAGVGKIDTQKDIFLANSVIESMHIENDGEEKIVDNESKFAISNSSLDSLPLNDSLLDTLPVKPLENLEDTVDVNNLTGIDSSANSDEIFCGNIVRTSTQAVESVDEQDTLPVTDSLFGSLPMSQESQSGSQFMVDIPRPELLDAVHPIYPSLAPCTESLKSIVGQLTYPLWINHLTAYFSNRGLQTIGDLAQLTEREINRIPVKGKSKTDFVKSILKHYETSNMQDSTILQEKTEDPSVADTKLIDDTNASSVIQSVASQEMEITPHSMPNETLSHSTPLVLASGSKSRNSLHTVPTDENSLEDLTQERIHATVSTLPLPTQIDISKTHVNISMESTTGGCTCGFIQKLATTKSIGTSTDPTSFAMSTPRKSTKSVEAQMELSELLDEIDVQLVLESAGRRCTPEKLLAEYKNKMKHVPDSELEVETIRLLGLEIRQNYKDATLKAACRACGVTKVLSRLPDIFSNDSQFFEKVLNTYRKKLKANDCLNTLDFAEVKKAVSQRCTPSELAEMLSQKLQEEDQAGISNPLNELPSLNAILKRMPIDVIISHTVANDELIPSRLVLDIALENNSSDTIAEVLRRKPNAFSKQIFDKLWSPKLAMEHITTSGQSKEKLLNIFKAVTSQLSAEELLNAYHEAMKQKL